MQPIWRTKQNKFSPGNWDLFSCNKSYCSVLQIGCISTDVLTCDQPPPPNNNNNKNGRSEGGEGDRQTSFLSWASIFVVGGRGRGAWSQVTDVQGLYSRFLSRVWQWSDWPMALRAPVPHENWDIHFTRTKVLCFSYQDHLSSYTRDGSSAMRKSSTNSSSDRINGVSVSSKSSKSFSSSISSGGKKEPAGCEDKVCFKFLDENVQSILIFYSFDGFKSKIAVDHGNISEARAESWTSPKEATSVRSFQTIFTIHEDLMWGNSENKLRLCGSSPKKKANNYTTVYRDTFRVCNNWHELFTRPAAHPFEGKGRGRSSNAQMKDLSWQGYSVTWCHASE